MSDNGVLKSGDFPHCPACTAFHGIDMPGQVRGTGLFRQLYEDEVFHGPVPETAMPTPLGPMPFRPGGQIQAPLIDPFHPPLLAAIRIKMLIATQEICEVCGCVWVSHWEIREVLGQAQVQGPQMPPGARGLHMNPH